MHVFILRFPKAVKAVCLNLKAALKKQPHLIAAKRLNINPVDKTHWRTLWLRVKIQKKKPRKNPKKR